MKVSELIELLKQVPQDVEVFRKDSDQCGEPVTYPVNRIEVNLTEHSQEVTIW